MIKSSKENEHKCKHLNAIAYQSQQSCKLPPAPALIFIKEGVEFLKFSQKEGIPIFSIKREELVKKRGWGGGGGGGGTTYFHNN